jgi:hypothetical protein
MRCCRLNSLAGSTAGTPFDGAAPDPEMAPALIHLTHERLDTRTADPVDDAAAPTIAISSYSGSLTFGYNLGQFNVGAAVGVGAGFTASFNPPDTDL